MKPQHPQHDKTQQDKNPQHKMTSPQHQTDKKGHEQQKNPQQHTHHDPKKGKPC